MDKIRRISQHNIQGRQFPQGVNRLFDLINVENEEYIDAFYFALRDTLVCEDIT